MTASTVSLETANITQQCVCVCVIRVFMSVCALCMQGIGLVSVFVAMNGPVHKPKLILIINKVVHPFILIN